jgi:hypothetical protein
MIGVSFFLAAFFAAIFSGAFRAIFVDFTVFASATLAIVVAAKSADAIAATYPDLFTPFTPQRLYPSISVSALQLQSTKRMNRNESILEHLQKIIYIHGLGSIAVVSLSSHNGASLLCSISKMNRIAA